MFFDKFIEFIGNIVVPVVVTLVIIGIILFILSRVVNFFSKVLPRKFVIWLLVILFSLIPLNIIKEYLILLKNCTFIGYVKEPYRTLYNWSNNFIFMENNKLGTFDSLDKAVDEAEKTEWSAIILEKNHQYSPFKITQIGLLEGYLSKEDSFDKQVSINDGKIKALGFDKYYISYKEGKKYERKIDRDFRIATEKDSNRIRENYKTYLELKKKGDIRYFNMLKLIAGNKYTPLDLLIEIKKTDSKSIDIAGALMFNPNCPYEFLFDFLEVENHGFHKGAGVWAVDAYIIRLRKEKRVDEFWEVQKALKGRDNKIYRKIHEKYEKIYQKQKEKNLVK